MYFFWKLQFSKKIKKLVLTFFDFLKKIISKKSITTKYLKKGFKIRGM